LINRAVPASELDKTTDELLGELVLGGPKALAASKVLLASVPQLDLADAFAYTAELSANLFKSDEAAEGIGAFRERRPAAWVPANRQ
jgi:methylglutaconyl-CoA hydratase